jgi:hypothetical protein
MEIQKEDWENAITANERAIKTNLIQIEMAKRIIELCEEKIKEFKMDEETEDEEDEEDD